MSPSQPTTTTTTTTTTASSATDPTDPTDVILPMSEPYTSFILSGHKTHEFRRYRLRPTVQRIWFYRTAPHSAITHIAEISPKPHIWSLDGPLPEDKGAGTREYNDPRQVQKWRRRFGEYAYRILAVWELRERISLAVMREKYGIKGPPRGPVYVPRKLHREVIWYKQKKILDVVGNGTSH